MDGQEHAAAWVARRGSNERELPDVPCIRLTAPKDVKSSEAAKYLRRQLLTHAEKYDVVVCDVGGFDSVELRSAIQVSNVALVPIVPSEWNVGAWLRMHSLLETAKEINEDLKVLGVLNQVSNNLAAGNREIADSREFLEEHFDDDGYHLAEQALRIRIVYRYLREGGLTLNEVQGSKYNPKADSEMTSVYQEVLDALR